MRGFVWEPRAALAGLALVAVVAACGDTGVPVAPRTRPSDGLLDEPELQRVVELQTRRDTGALVPLLSDPRPEVRARAALALASVQAPGAVLPLAAALADEEAAVRRDAAFALGQTGLAGQAQVLVDALGRESDPSVRRRLFEALSKLPAVESAQGLVTASVAEGEEAERTLALARLGAATGVATRESQNHLLARLDDADPEVRVNAAYYFGRLAAPAAWAEQAGRVRSVLATYDRDEPAAMYLVQALGRLGDPSDGGRLREWLASAGDWRIRANAAAALAGLPPNPQNREALLAALDDPSGLVATAAGQSLGRGSPVPSELQRLKAWIGANPDRWQAAAPLLVLLARGDEREFVFGWIDTLDPEDAYRWGAGLAALAQMPGEEALERLRVAVASESSRIQGAAVSALTQRWSQDRRFTGHHELYFQLFAGVLRGGSLQASFSAAQALSDPLFAGFGAVDTLLAAYGRMEAPDQLEPMIAVLESLGRTGAPRALPLLEEAALSPRPGLRRAAVTALEGLERPVPEFEGEDVVGPGVTGPPELDWDALRALGPAPTLVLETEEGTVRVRLHTEEAPLTVQTLARLAGEGRFDGVPFHRVVPNFVAQGGDFTSGDGFGGPGFTITSEFTEIRFLAGVVGMASAGKDTEGSQFFITHSMQPHLDGAYTAFGWVEAGMDAVNRLNVGDRIVRATIEPTR